MRNKILSIFLATLLLIFSAVNICADEFTPPQMSEGQMPQGMQPPEGGRPNFQNGELPADFPQGEMPPRGQMPQGEGRQFPQGEMPMKEAPANITSSETKPAEGVKGGIKEDPSTEADENQTTEQTEVPATENGFAPPEGFNPENMGNFNFGQQGTANQTPENPFTKWITPIFSVVFLIFGFLFVALYKRKKY